MALFDQALEAHKNGRFKEAENLYRKIIANDSRNFDALHMLGIVCSENGKVPEAEQFFLAALAVDSKFPPCLHNYGLFLAKQQRYQDSIQQFDKALNIFSGFAPVYSDRGICLMELGRLDESLASHDRAVALAPNAPIAFYNRGNTLFKQRNLNYALQNYDRAIALHPKYADAYCGRGNVLSDLKLYDEARAAYRAALTHNPNLSHALVGLTLLLLSEGNIAEALDLARRALAQNETFETKSSVALCLCSPLIHSGLGDVRDLLLRALTEPWTRPLDLAVACARFLVLNDAIRDSMARATKAWPRLLSAEELVGSSSLAKLAEDRLLRALLESVPVCEVALERFATGLRFILLEDARAAADSTIAEPLLGLYCALARQCFINNYVFAQSDVEIEQAQALRSELAAALASGAAIPTLSLVAVAAYFPLHSLPSAESLLDRPWPDAVGAVLAQQVRAPIEEQSLRTSMPVLTAIEDDVSIQVRAQYEESPYPQWTKAAPAGSPKTVDAFIREKFPLSPFVELGKNGEFNILVAGCGTGRHSVDTACCFKAARILAVDLSLTSLCYAQRQTRALGLNTIQYAQADIMNLPSIGRTFDVIEAVGVLHHLADPFAAWRVLLSLLRPRGIMRLGLYSETARREIVAVRDFIAERGYRPTADGIRRCRQELLDFADDTPLKKVTSFWDFFGLNECRDLLFHSQEHRLALPEIAAFIAENNLQFLGFELDSRRRRNYAREFPADIAMTNLAQWHRYETDNPRTFINMYQFWVQKA